MGSFEAKNRRCARPPPVRRFREGCGCSFQLVVGQDTQGRSGEKADRRASRELIAAYHLALLRALLEHVRAGFAQLDAGDIDEFNLDDLIHHYKRSAAELRNFCGWSGGQWQQAAHTLTYFREHGGEPDWWEMGAPPTHQVVLIRITPTSDRKPDPLVQIESSAQRGVAGAGGVPAAAKASIRKRPPITPRPHVPVPPVKPRS